MPDLRLQPAGTETRSAPIARRQTMIESEVKGDAGGRVASQPSSTQHEHDGERGAYFSGAALAGYELPGALSRPLRYLISHQAPFVMRPRWMRALYRIAKRGLDIALCLALLVMTLPLFLAVAVLIKATSPGPVLFSHRRIGRGGKEFSCVKFRTMMANAEEQLKRNAQLREQFDAK